jgi:hypothetical protein
MAATTPPGMAHSPPQNKPGAAQIKNGPAQGQIGIQAPRPAMPSPANRINAPGKAKHCADDISAANKVIGSIIFHLLFILYIMYVLFPLFKHFGKNI